MPAKPEDVLSDRTRPFNGAEYLESLRDGARSISTANGSRM
jgi:hypothetical protein